MISSEQIYSYFPNLEKTDFLKKGMVREYLQFMILDFLSTRPFINKLILVGGPAIRFKYGLDRFTRDLFFNLVDCSEDDFIKITDSVISFLEKSGIKVESKYKENPNQSSFKRYLYFPKYSFNIKFSVFEERRFFTSIGAIQNKLMQGSTIRTEIDKYGFSHKLPLGFNSGFEAISGCGFSFLFQVPSISVLFAMKLGALILRKNGRDFYDGLFLRKFTKPDYVFLKHRVGVSNKTELHTKLTEALKYVDFESKVKDVENLVFDKQSLDRIRNFWKIIL